MQSRRKKCLSLHCNGAKSYLFVEIIKSKAKDSEIKPTPLCLGNVSNKFLLIIWKRLDFINFSVDYDAIVVDDILDIH